ncbi:histo-blood group ABO system transferase-like, partial [Pyxicephalus adspersus]|uniref:histo-blood group ABO system transferase-like n=1 Tax=Pyxicephalus adspersus TaxID=30357 RepID=UPI003B58FCCD
RIDVLTMTPWFAPIVWNGTYNSDILNAQFHQNDVHVGLTVFAIKKLYHFRVASGGTVEEVYRLTNFCHNAMMVDKEKQIEAIWHDESYLNKYFLYEKPTKILSPEYLWDNNFQTPSFLKRRRFVAVPKNHNAIRNRRELMGVSVASGKFHR